MYLSDVSSVPDGSIPHFKSTCAQKTVASRFFFSHVWNVHWNIIFDSLNMMLSSKLCTKKKPINGSAQPTKSKYSTYTPNGIIKCWADDFQRYTRIQRKQLENYVQSTFRLNIFSTFIGIIYSDSVYIWSLLFHFG